MNLAINGGTPIRTAPNLRPNTITPEDRRAVNEVLLSGVLSDFMGVWGDKFNGGERVQRLERRFEQYFGIEHAVSMNSATTGLVAACGAIGINPGDEVIVPPTTMIATASAPIHYGGVPVFADIDPLTFCITEESIEKVRTEHTKAIIAVDLFGHPAEIIQSLPLIEDAAQALGASYHGKPAGTLGDVGVFSLNYHKHIHCGEGGVVVTDDDIIADRLRMIRNHGEVCAADAGVTDLTNLVGYNFRLGEMEAALAYEQLTRLPGIVHARQQNAAYLTRQLAGIPGITLPTVAEGCTHAWYLYAMKYNAQVFGVHRDVFVQAVQAEGVPLVSGYVKPIYLEPMYQQRIAIGREGWPFSLRPERRYQRGDCPVAERMYFDELMYTSAVQLEQRAQADFVNVIYKVVENIDELRS